MELNRKSSGSKSEVRCTRCGSLLAVREAGGVSIRRGEMQSIVSGTDFTVSVSCYRCKSLSVISSQSKSTAHQRAV